MARRRQCSGWHLPAARGDPTYLGAWHGRAGGRIARLSVSRCPCARDDRAQGGLPGQGRRPFVAEHRRGVRHRTGGVSEFHLPVRAVWRLARCRGRQRVPGAWHDGLVRSFARRAGEGGSVCLGRQWTGVRGANHQRRDHRASDHSDGQAGRVSSREGGSDRGVFIGEWPDDAPSHGGGCLPDGGRHWCRVCGCAQACPDLRDGCLFRADLHCPSRSREGGSAWFAPSGRAVAE